MPNEDLKQAIASSFLDEERKTDVLRRLESEGATAAFWNALRQGMIAEIERRGRLVGEEMARFDAEIAVLDAVAREKSGQALAALTAQLEKLRPSDMAGKGRLWEAYYQAEERSQADYDKAVKAKIAEMTMRLA